MATENEIIDGAFYLLEKDADPWATTDDEYTTARGMLNLGVGRWERYENTTWRELWTTLTDSAIGLGGDKTVVASTWDYDAPSDFVRAGGYVTITPTAGEVVFYHVLPPEEVKKYSGTTTNWCYFTGNKNTGFDLHFNPNATLSTGGVIDYPYYKSATQSSAASTVLEVGDPNFLSYFIAAHMSENSDSVDGDFFQISEDLLKQMKSVNNSGFWGVPSNIEPSLEDYIGFGSGGGNIASSSNPTGR